MRVKAFAILSQRANIVCLRVSKMRPIVVRFLSLPALLIEARRRRAAQHVVRVHRVEVLAHLVNLSVAYHEQKMVALGVRLAAHVLTETFRLDRDAVILRRSSRAR